VVEVEQSETVIQPSLIELPSKYLTSEREQPKSRNKYVPPSLRTYISKVVEQTKTDILPPVYPKTDILPPVYPKTDILPPALPSKVGNSPSPQLSKNRKKKSGLSPAVLRDPFTFDKIFSSNVQPVKVASVQLEKQSSYVQLEKQKPMIQRSQTKVGNDYSPVWQKKKQMKAKSDIKFTSEELALPPLRCYTSRKPTRRYYIKSAWNGYFVGTRLFPGRKDCYALIAGHGPKHSTMEPIHVVLECDPMWSTLTDCWIRRSDNTDRFFVQLDAKVAGRGKRLLAPSNGFRWNCQKFQAKMVGADARGILMEVFLKPKEHWEVDSDKEEADAIEQRLVRVAEDCDWGWLEVVNQKKTSVTRPVTERNRRELFYLVSDRTSK